MGSIACFEKVMIMNIYISTNLYSPENLIDIFNLLDMVGDSNIGIELFPEWQNKVFSEMLRKNIDRFKEYNISLHGPYYDTEHSSERNSESYKKTMEYFKNTLKLSQELKSRYIVYHHNNCQVIKEKKEEMMRISSENLLELNKLAKKYDGNIVVENCGVISHENMLFDEDEFIEMAENIPNDILIDIGHAFANGWDLNNVIYRLKEKIVSYHLHNNDGFEDCHDSIRKGKIDIDEFFKMYRKYTPNADLVIEYGKQCGNDMKIIDNDIDFIKNKIYK